MRRQGACAKANTAASSLAAIMGRSAMSPPSVVTMVSFRKIAHTERSARKRSNAGHMRRTALAPGRDADMSTFEHQAPPFPSNQLNDMSGLPMRRAGRCDRARPATCRNGTVIRAEVDGLAAQNHGVAGHPVIPEQVAHHLAEIFPRAAPARPRPSGRTCGTISRIRRSTYCPTACACPARRDDGLERIEGRVNDFRRDVAQPGNNCRSRSKWRRSDQTWNRPI